MNATGHWGFEPLEHTVRHTHTDIGTSPSLSLMSVIVRLVGRTRLREWQGKLITMQSLVHQSKCCLHLLVYIATTFAVAVTMTGGTSEL